MKYRFANRVSFFFDARWYLSIYASGKKKNIGDMMVQETIPFSQERIKAVIISSSAGMKRLISQIDNTKNQLLSISMVASTGKQQGPAHEEKKHNLFSHS